MAKYVFFLATLDHMRDRKMIINAYASHNVDIHWTHCTYHPKPFLNDRRLVSECPCYEEENIRNIQTFMMAGKLD